MTSGIRLEDDQSSKRFTEAATIAAQSYITSLSENIVHVARMRSIHEEVLREDVHAAIDEITTPRRRGKAISEWLKWIGFFAAGLFFPMLISWLNADKPDKGSLLWLALLLVIASVTLIPAFILDFSSPRFRRKIVER